MSTTRELTETMVQARRTVAVLCDEMKRLEAEKAELHAALLNVVLADQDNYLGDAGEEVGGAIDAARVLLARLSPETQP